MIYHRIHFVFVQGGGGKKKKTKTNQIHVNQKREGTRMFQSTTKHQWIHTVKPRPGLNWLCVFAAAYITEMCFFTTSLLS